ncbi:MAG: hypothetical protein KAQ67_02285, partial [Gammaproteobacteria bacterium]|nr:hypothetical protein [Gammaproteobacteria bacterium]
MNNKIIAAIIVVVFVGGWGVSFMLSTGSGEMKKESAVEHAEKHSDPNYVCPMHPQIVRGEPGNCPICGMDLIEIEEEKPTAKKERKILYWVAPMDANYRRDEPG